MAKNENKKPAPRNPAKAIEQLEQPKMRWKVIALVAFAFIMIWALVLGLIPYISYWGVIGAGVLTLIAAGFGLYALRLTRRSKQIVNILKTATDEEGRQAALEKLKQAKDSDVMAKLAQAQLVGRDSPSEAIKILESIDIDKAPAPVQNDVRANLGLLYLMHNRAKEARPLADEIHLDRNPQPKAKALYAAVVAEAFARTGKASEAKNLLETYQPSDPEYGEMGAMLYRAQVYTFMATKNRGLAKKSMQALAQIDPNMVAAFAMKGSNPALAKMARQVMQSTGVLPKQKMKVMRR